MKTDRKALRQAASAVKRVPDVGVADPRAPSRAGWYAACAVTVLTAEFLAAFALVRALRRTARKIERELDDLREQTEPLWEVGDTNSKLKTVLEKVDGKV